MDYLVLGDIMLNKAHMPQAQINQAKEVTFAKD
jgi:hypothetical protein